MARKSIQDRLKAAAEAAKTAQEKADEKQKTYDNLKKEVMGKRDEKILKKFKTIYPESDLAVMSEPEFDHFLKNVQMTQKEEKLQVTNSVKTAETPVKQNPGTSPAAPVQANPVNQPVSADQPKQASPFHEEREANKLFAQAMREQEAKKQQNLEHPKYPRGYVLPENRHSEQNR